MRAQVDCGAGYWCAAGATSTTACPAGTSSPALRAGSAAACALCPSGKYCAGEAQTVPTGDCAAGSFCKAGATKASYTAAETTANYGTCPIDHYCVVATGDPVHCGDGKWSEGNTGLPALASCSLCPAGQYCDSTSTVPQPTGLCQEGFYCLAGSSVPAPEATPCSAGHFCPTGSPV